MQIGHRNELQSRRLERQPSVRAKAFCSDEGPTPETSALQLITVANLHPQPSWYDKITLLPPPTQYHSFFRNFHP